MRLIGCIEDYFYKIKYAFQRAFRGYDDREVFNMDEEFLKRYTKILKDIKKTTYSYPDSEVSEKEWGQILDEIITYFELSNSNNEYYNNIDDRDEVYKLSYKSERKALELFVRWFDYLSS